MENNLKLVEQFLAEANMTALDFYSITISPYRIALQGSFDRDLGLKASLFGEGRLGNTTGFIGFNFQYNGANIDITLT
jgi:hypothetical protein